MEWIMNDQKIKNLIQNDNHSLQAPLGEWSQIKRKLEKKQVHFFWEPDYFKLALVGCSLVLCFFLVQAKFKSTLESEEDLTSYLMDESYLDFEQDSLYAWVDLD